MVHIQRMITHILNPSENLMILSDRCMEDVEEAIQKALESKMDKIFTSTRRRQVFYRIVRFFLCWRNIKRILVRLRNSAVISQGAFSIRRCRQDDMKTSILSWQKERMMNAAISSVLKIYIMRASRMLYSSRMRALKIRLLPQRR